MDLAKRRELAGRLLDGYESGPAATTRATAGALGRAEHARVVILVEGISDQMALETLAPRLGRDLAAHGTVVLPMGGAHAIARYARRFGPQGAGLRLAGLCDTGEEAVFRRGLAAAGAGAPATRDDLARLGFFVCVEDLEDELIRAVGPAAVETLVESQGDLGSFRSMQAQPAWRDGSLPAQLRRFFGSGSRRKLRYARLLAGAVAVERVPRPLAGLLAHLDGVPT